MLAARHLNLEEFPPYTARCLVGNKKHFYVDRTLVTPAFKELIGETGSGKDEAMKLLEKAGRPMKKAHGAGRETLTEEEKASVSKLKKDIGLVAGVRANKVFAWLEFFGSDVLVTNGHAKVDRDGAFHMHLTDGSNCYTVYWYENPEAGVICPFYLGTHESDPSKSDGKRKPKATDILSGAAERYSAAMTHKDSSGALLFAPAFGEMGKRGRDTALAAHEASEGSAGAAASASSADA